MIDKLKESGSRPNTYGAFCRYTVEGNGSTARGRGGGSEHLDSSSPKRQCHTLDSLASLLAKHLTWQRGEILLEARLVSKGFAGSGDGANRATFSAPMARVSVCAFEGLACHVRIPRRFCSHVPLLPMSFEVGVTASQGEAIL